MLKPCLQLLICIVIALRAAGLIHRLRRLWQQGDRSLAAEFRRELQRRGQLPVLPGREGIG